MRFLVPLEVEPYEAKRRRELSVEIHHLDLELTELLEKLRQFQTTNFSKTRSTSRELSELEDARIDLAARRNAALAEYANLV